MEQAIALYIEHVGITDTTLSMEERIEAAGWKTANYLVIVGVTASGSRWFGSSDDETVWRSLDDPRGH